MAHGQPEHKDTGKKVATPRTEAKPGKRRRRKAARPAEIIEAGLAVFAENGFAATRLDDIAAYWIRWRRWWTVFPAAPKRCCAR